MYNIPVPITELPFTLTIGEIQCSEKKCPGVYFVSTRSPGHSLMSTSDYYVVMDDSPAISPEAKHFGELVQDSPKAILFDCNNYFNKGRHVVEYEILRYLYEQGLPIPNGYSLKAARIYGMEVCPEYFGEFPLPTETPWGNAIQHDRLYNGLYWIKTVECGWCLAIAYPLCDDVDEKTLDFALLTDRDRTEGIDNTYGFRFYTYQSSCVPLLELSQFTKDEWLTKINLPALQNAVVKNFPEYAANAELTWTEGCGVDFYQFQD